jgi:hypothetical protein
MTDADDSVARAVAALRVEEQPAAEALRAAPILDGWYFYHPFRNALNGVGAKGVVSGDSRFADGTAIFTSAIRTIDGRDGQPAWVRTRNTLYKLGWPRAPLPPVLQVALASSWDAALVLAGTASCARTLPAAVLPAYDAVCADTIETACTGKSPDWALRRTAAAAIAGALTATGRTSVAAAWQLIAVDARKDAAAAAVSALLEAAALDIAHTPEIETVLAGWALLANGTSLGEDLADCVSAAQRIGARHTRDAGTGSEEPPLLVRMVLAKDWWAAADILLDDAPQTKLGTVVPFVRGAGTPKELRPTAWSLFEEYRDKGEHDRAAGWRLLAVDPTDVVEIAWVIDELTTLQRSAAPPSDLAWAVALGQAIAAWHLLAAADGPLNDPDDAIASAWQMHAAHVQGAGGDAASNDLPRFRPDEPTTDTEPAGIVVLPAVGGTHETSSGRDAVREFKAITAEKLPLVVVPDLARARATLRDEFPHLHAAIDVLLTGLVAGEPLRLRPTLLAGAPGGGKSRLARRLAETLELPLHRFDGSGSSDNTFGGTPRRWSSGEHCAPLEAVRRHRVANPMVLIDEIDKAGASRHNGALTSALLPFLEPENARAYPDPYVQSEVDLSHVNYILTCNEDSALPGPLRDRLRIVRLPRPTIEHLPALARGIVADIAKERGGDPRWWPPLDDPELAIAEELWRGGSVRRLRAIVERLLAYRELKPRN